MNIKRRLFLADPIARMKKFIFLFLIQGLPGFTYSQDNCTALSVKINTQTKNLKKYFNQPLTYQDIYAEFKEIKKQFLSNCNTYKTPIKDKQTFFDDSRKYKKKYYSNLNFPIEKKECEAKYVDTTNFPENQNQNQFQWCHCYALANQLSFYVKTKLSVYDICAQSLLESSLPSQKNTSLAERGKSPFLDLVDIIKVGKGICREIDFSANRNQWDELNRFIYKINKVKDLQSLTSCEECLNQHPAFSNLTKDLIPMLDKLSPDKRLNAILDVQCKDRVSLPFSNNSTRGIEIILGYNTEDYHEIDETLNNENPEPILFTYDINSIATEKFESGTHAMNIIGRKWNHETSKCEYLVKNSWGNSCARLNTTIVKCDKETGAFWIDRDTLFRNIIEIYDLRKIRVKK